MTRWTAGLTAALLTSSAFAQSEPPPRSALSQEERDRRDNMPRMPDKKPTSKYDVTAAAGPWLVCVKSYKGDRAGDLAGAFVEYIRKEYKLPAFVHLRGWDEYLAEDKRVQEVIKIKKAEYVARGEEPPPTYKVKRLRIELEYAIFVAPQKGPLNNDEEAGQFLRKTVRLLPPPPDEFLHTVVVSGDEGTQYSALNPFQTAMAVPNPAIARAKPETGLPKITALMKELNAKEDYSLLKTAKPYTLLVRVYNSPSVVQPKDRSLVEKLFSDGGAAQYLEAMGKQAHNVAEALRGMKPSYDAYVLHTKYVSYVCVGQYDKPDDEKLLSTMRTLANMQLRDKEGNVAEQFMAAPVAMMVPQP